MKKMMLVGMLVLSLGVVANDEVIIDKQVTGVNKEQLEGLKTSNEVNLDKKVIKIQDETISADKYKDQKQVIQLVEEEELETTSLTENSGTPIWKYIIGVVALVTLGIAL